MRHVICALATLLCALPPALHGADLTVILKFEAAHSQRSDAEMRLETERLLRDSGVSLDWRMLDQISPTESFANLAVVRFKGRCEITQFLPRGGEPSTPLGVTHRVDGHVIPFSEVQCDEVRAALGWAHLPASPDSRELLYGRALGRVLAHELLHVVNRSGRHARHGVSQKYLSAAGLTDNQID